MKINVDTSGLDPLRAGFATAPAYTLGRLRRAMRTAVLMLEGEVKGLTPAAHGTLRQSVFGETRDFPDGLGVEGVVASPQQHAPYVELGTRPHLPPLAPLVDWVEVKLGLSGKEAERAARAIRWAIGKRGTLGVGMFHRSLAFNEVEIGALFDRAAADIAAHLAGGAA